MIKHTITTPTYSKECIFDEKGYELFNSKVWSISPHQRGFYLRRREKINGKYRTIMFHRELLNLTDSKSLVDHINGNGLDNRLSNLRLANHSTNAMNSKKIKAAGSKYKGVYKHKKCVNWTARIQSNGIRLVIGYYSTEEEAARAYDKKSKELFGEFTVLNFPEENK